MKKILLAMAALLGCATMSFAQNNYVATLQHEGEFTHYYGADALKSAYNAAAEGDIITLSPGTFNSPGTINKGITLRGTGIDAAAVSYVSGDVTFCSTDSNRVVTTEGVCFSSRIYIQNNSSGNGQGRIKFIKARFNNGFTANKAGTYSTIKGPEVRIYNVCSNNDIYYESNSFPDIFVYNSYIDSPYSDFRETTSAFINCYINYTAGIYYNSSAAQQRANNMNFYNCIFNHISPNHNYYFPSTVTCYNCLCYGRNTLFDHLLYGGNNQYVNSSDIFSSEEGHKWYELTPEAQETYLGTDGTQVGLYGGNYPYNTKVQYPIITQFSTDVQTSKEGILNINVEVDGQ